MLSLAQRTVVFVAFGGVFLLGEILFTILRGSFDHGSLRSLAALAGMLGLGTVVLVLFPNGLAGTIASIAAGGATGSVVLWVAAN